MPTPTRRILVLIASLIVAESTSASSHADEPSAEYRAVLRRTLENRKGRRENRGAAPTGKIMPYPMPPSLIIRHTREVHGDIGNLLGLLRR